jgi:hypothetical protein
MHTEACTEPNCGKSFTKKNKAKADLAMRLHMLRKHGLKPNGEAVPPAAPKPKRTWKRKVVSAEVAINFCPRCGTDIHRVAVGMALAERVKGKAA